MSRIKSLRGVSVSYPEPNDAGFTRYLTFARIETEDGVVGWGESIPMSGSGFPEACHATETIIEGLADIVVGSSALDNLEIVRRIKDRTWWYGPEGIASFALSAIDMALWDVKGKSLGVSLVELLGGARKSTLRAIAATHATLPDVEAEAARHGEMVRSGFAGVKVGFSERSGGLGFDVNRDISFMQLLREACGPEADLMLDRGQSLRWDVESATRRVRGFEEYGLRWIEEPFEPYDIQSFRTLRSRVSTLIATGEREWNLRAYRRLLAHEIADVIGCDPGRSEGVTGFMGLVKLVESQGVWFNAHSWSSAVNTAASLAVSATSDRCLVFELKPEESPMQHELVDAPFTAVNGEVAVPSGPGLGVEVNESVIEKYRLR